MSLELTGNNDGSLLAFAQAAEIIKFFEWKHLPADLAEVSKPFAELAEKIATPPFSFEIVHALRKLLEAKDCAVRAALLKRNDDGH